MMGQTGDMTRVIAGQARGRRLQVPSGRTTRPTGDRVREAMFAAAGSVLGSFEGARVLDLYAGSGAAGLEALSRRDAPSPPRAIRPSLTPVVRAGGRLVRAVDDRLRAGGRPAGDEPYDVLFAD